VKARLIARRGTRGGLQDRVVFAGRVSDDDLSVLIKRATHLVLPSIARTEAFGVVQIEAMAGRAVPSSARICRRGVPWVNRRRQRACRRSR
jgi:glycosyltransferase involved in cell wall biosynthesis